MSRTRRVNVLQAQVWADACLETANTVGIGSMVSAAAPTRCVRAW